MNSFVRKHRLTLKEAILTPMVWREQILGAAPGDAAFPPPSAALLRDFAAYVGYSYGALRTALSRARAQGELDAQEDGEGRLRYRLVDVQRAVGGVVASRKSRPEGYLIAVYAFRAQDEAGRRKVREILSWFGFVRFAQNAWVNGLIDASGLEKALEWTGLANMVFLFRCSSAMNPSLDERFARRFRLKERAGVLQALWRDLEAFLLAPALDAVERGRRFVYAGPVQHKVCFMEEPPVPATCLPDGYPLEDLLAWFGAEAARAKQDIMAYFRRFEEA
jgi:DNA-binding transcriptional regulator PaaX